MLLRLSSESDVSNSSMAQAEDHSETSEPKVESMSSSSTVSPESGVIPYSLPSHHRSILVNSLLPKTDTRLRRISKPLFPAKKSVIFKEPLIEEVQTSLHVLAHWDLVEEYKAEEAQKLLEEQQALIKEVEPVVVPMAPVAPVEQPEDNVQSPTRMRLADFKFPILTIAAMPASSTPAAVEDISSPFMNFTQNISTSSSATTSPISAPPAPPAPPAPELLSVDAPVHPPLLQIPQILPHRAAHRGHLKRDSSSSNSPTSPSSEDNESDDSLPHTPVAGRCKKQRMWMWTLDTVEGEDGLAQPHTPTETLLAPEDISLPPDADEGILDEDVVMIGKEEMTNEA
jgi:hypothetical protein